MRGAGELRVKESDRIAALVAGFRALGIDADERPDGFVDRRPGRRSTRPAGGRADARGDHRMAMAFAIAALARASSPRTIDGADVVAISYPGFFETLAPARRREGRQDLSGRLHGRRQDDASRGRWRGGSAGEAVDIDEVIEQRERQTVADIFAQTGRGLLPRRRARRR